MKLAICEEYRRSSRLWISPSQQSADHDTTAPETAASCCSPHWKNRSGIEPAALLPTWYLRAQAPRDIVFLQYLANNDCSISVSFLVPFCGIVAGQLCCHSTTAVVVGRRCSCTLHRQRAPRCFVSRRHQVDRGAPKTSQSWPAPSMVE